MKTSKDKKQLISQFQRSHITQSTFKRNKNYIDIQKIIQDQKKYSIKRRKPLLLQSNTPKSINADNQILLNFKNSYEKLNNKLEKDTLKFKHRVSSNYITDSQILFNQTQRNSLNINNPQIQLDTESRFNDKQINQMNLKARRSSLNFTDLVKQFNNNQNKSNMNYMNMNNNNNSSLLQSNSQSFTPSSPKTKGITFQRQIDRDYLHRIKVHKNQIVDERNFNNFYISKHNLSHTQDFKKLSPRKSDSIVNKSINDLHYDTQKRYQKFYFTDQTMKTKFRYSLQNSKQERKFYIAMREENIAKGVIDQQKINKSFSEASNFKRNKIDGFYKLTGRNRPHQLDQRELGPLNNYYKDSNNRLIKQKIDYSVKNMYDDLLNKQKTERYRKKNPQFTRDQICDQKYFKEIIKKENRQNKYIQLAQMKKTNQQQGSMLYVEMEEKTSIKE